MPTVLIKKGGKWADPEPHIPQREFVTGQTYDVSPRLAEAMVQAGAAEYAREQKPGSEHPGKADKRRADKGRYNG